MFFIRKILIILISVPILLSATEYQLSTHILDITSGEPASKVRVELYYLDKNQHWKKISEKFTKLNGRIEDLIPYEKPENRASGIYKLKFYTKDYYRLHNINSFYPFIEVSFEISKEQKHYHVPITLSPFGYSTYRGN